MGKPVLSVADKAEIREIWLALHSRTSSSHISRFGRHEGDGRDRSRKKKAFEADPDYMSDGCSCNGHSIYRSGS